MKMGCSRCNVLLPDLMADNVAYPKSRSPIMESKLKFSYTTIPSINHVQYTVLSLYFMIFYYTTK